MYTIYFYNICISPVLNIFFNINLIINYFKRFLIWILIKVNKNISKLNIIKNLYSRPEF